MPTHSTGDTPACYSYIRFSHPDQAKGDSLRRQVQAAADWCEMNGLRLDTTTTLHDLGKSAYTGKHRTNPDRNALAAFLKLVESGRIAHGSHLLIENLDRLSREDEVPACHLLTGILMAGIRVVQLSPYEMVLTEKSNGWELMRAVMELSRGHGESAIKSERVGKAWAEKKKRARAGEAQKDTARMGPGCKVLTRMLPAWIEERGGVLHLIPARAAVVKRIFHLAAGGYGYQAIVRKLTEEGVPPFGTRVLREGKKRSQFSGYWTPPYVVLILNDRRAVGEYQPYGRGRKPEGDPIAGYFPAAVTPEEYAAAQGARDRRRKKNKVGQEIAACRVGRHVNLFSGLLRNARDGDTYIAGSTPNRVLFTLAAHQGRGKSWSFPLPIFEEAVLSVLKEINPHDILNGGQGPDESLVLAGELARVEAKIDELTAELLKGDVAALAKVLRDLEAQKQDLARKLAEARQRAAHPLSEVWGEAQTLLETLAAAPDPRDARMRLRAALRRMVNSIWMLVVPRGVTRLAAVQIWFDGGRHRDYLILYKSAGRCRPGGWWARSFARAAISDDFDLRNREDAAQLETVLLHTELANLEG
jgi:DNA invertase Pin-like site-specific DNA recombinase